ncbi:MAG: TonB-dependent receptor [Alteraurantiacibacter sp.]
MVNATIQTRRSHRIEAFTLALMLGSSMAYCGTAQAQSDAGEAAADGQGDVILVTAQKRSEDLLDVPISMAAISGEALEQNNLRDIEDIALVTPGLGFSQSGQFGDQVVSFRGISTVFGSATTGYYLDEIPLQQTNLTSVVLPHVFEVERVEVLRGPQGTLYGAGSMGGTIRYIRPQPDLFDTSIVVESEGSITDGGDPSVEGSVIANIPLVEDRIGFRGGVYYRHEGGWIDQADRNTGNIIDENINIIKTLAVTGILEIRASDTFSLSPSVFYQRTKTSDRDVGWAGAGDYVTYGRFAQPRDDEYGIFGLTADLELGDVDVKSVTSYMDRTYSNVDDWADSDGTVVASYIFNGIASGFDEPPPGFPFGLASLSSDWRGLMYWDVDSHAFSQELRASSSSDSPLQWIAGVYYQRNEFDLLRNEYQDINAESIALLGFPIDDNPLEGPLSAPLGLPVTYLQDQTTILQEMAAFANVTYALTDRLSFSAGARIARTRFEIRQRTAGFWLGPDVTYTGEQSETPISPKFNVNFEADRNHTLYASMAKGFRIGGYNQDFSTTICSVDLPPEGNPTEFGSDTLWSYEAGSKNRFANGRVQLNASAFHIRWNNIQSQVVMPTCLNIYTDNLGSAEVNGFDLDLSVDITPSLSVSMMAGYAHGQYTDTVEKFGQVLVVEGQDFAQPKLTGSASLTYDGEIGNVPAFGTLTFAHAGSYQRNVPNTPGDDPAIRDAESVNQLSARVGIELGRATISVFGENLTNARPELGLSRLISNDFPPDMILLRTLRPRTIGVGLKISM